MLNGKTVLLGVTGSIAAYKIAGLASSLVKQHAEVHVLMTSNAQNFIHPTTFETLTGHKCCIDTFDRQFQFDVKHISLAKKADIVMIAPASANIIGKIANGIADDMLTTTVMACKCPVYLAPAMNTAMFENPIVQDNLKKLRHYGYYIIEPAEGHLACGDSGKGKMPEPAVLQSCIEREIACEKDLSGRHILITAGATQESIDPVRYITNHSTGKMGYALARQAMLRGAEVTLITGRTALATPPFVDVIQVTTAQEMFEAVASQAQAQDIIIMTAAVADYRPAQVAPEKIKKGAQGDNLSIALERTQDILAWLGSHKRKNQFLCGFSMETENLLENSERKLNKKNLDMICANSLRDTGAGFGVDTNVVTLITKQTDPISLPLMSKTACADHILSHIITLYPKA